MSDSSKKKEEKVIVTLSMDKSLYESIVKQFELLKDKRMDGFPQVETIEEFILFYLKWLASENDQMKVIETKVNDILETLKDKGIDLMSEFNFNSEDFAKSMKSSKEESEDKEKEENSKEPVAKKKS
ncbi:hypothetical protein MSUIS_04060 [Mycoplasma suis KI3806]|uniref:Uncharacterized protein n=1 Tax=Mycoplasma suis (strain KI_3806) TaxID=708248 RepID=F0V1G8_MYCS3|nr:hypothetical protein [Mycoplasma suis]CBZ40499.1 hypothetical protein MSUIS_04060 [Mycoplasma suis KI3806]